MAGKVQLLNADASSGAAVTNFQREMNSLASFLGKDVNTAKDDLPGWNNDDVGDPADDVFARADALTATMNETTGHTHDGTPGNGAPVLAASLASVRLRGYFIRGANLVAVTGSSLVVTTQMTGKTASSGDTVKGVVTSANNQVVLRDNASATQGDQLRDGSGDLIFGRITEAAGVWTLSFYKNVAGVQTAHAFAAQDIGWYYQELFNPITDAPIYNELASIPSDNATQDVVDATSSQRGLVSSGTQNLGGAKTFTDTTQSTTKDTGAIILKGGLGIEKNINAGGAIAATGAVSGSNLSGINTGDQTVTLTGDVTGSGAGSFAATIAANAVTNAKAAQMANGTIKGRTTAGTGNAEDLTGAQATALLSNVVGDSGSGGTKGLVPAPAAGDAAAGKFLKSDGAWATPSGGGGGGSLQWVEDANSPTPIVENAMQVYAFQSALAQALYALIRVPNGYVAGSPIKLRSVWYGPDSSGTALINAVATLIRPGTDLITSTTNQRTTTNAAVTQSAGTANKPQDLVLDISSSTGQINAVSVSAGDLIQVKLRRDTDTGASDLKVPVYGAEVTFS